jgi:uncharacterized protein YdaU (DUF1376 family)
MNYYKRHIGDYMKDASHLSLLEHGVFMRLLDVYYTREAAIPADQAARLVGARSKEEREALLVVCGEFFKLVDGCYVQSRCDREIAAMQAKQETNRVIGQRGGRPKKKPTDNPNGFQTETQTVSRINPDVTQATSHKPLTINQGAFVEHQQGGPDGPAHADFENGNAGDAGPDNREAQAVAEAMRAAGLVDVSATNPKLRALLAAGLTPAELLDAAAYAVGSGKGFAYAMARAEGQRRDAATAASLPAAPLAAAVDPDSKAGIEASAKALSLPGWDQTAEQWPQFAARVRKARGDTPAQAAPSLADLARMGVSA